MFHCLCIVLHRYYISFDRERRRELYEQTQHMRHFYLGNIHPTILWSEDEIETTDIRKMCHTNILCNCQRLAQPKNERKKKQQLFIRFVHISGDEQRTRRRIAETQQFNLLHAAHLSLWTLSVRGYYCWLQLKCRLSIQLKSFKCSGATQRQN